MRALIGFDLVHAAQKKAHRVDAFQQAVTAERLQRERLGAAIGQAQLLRLDIDGDLRAELEFFPSVWP